MKSTLAVLILAVSFNAAFAQLQSDSLLVHIIGDTVFEMSSVAAPAMYVRENFRFDGSAADR